MIGRRLIGLFILALTLAACDGGGGGGGGGSTSVQWGDYASDLKGRIDGEAARKDCAALQTDFDDADANNDATVARTGHNNAELMGYIDDAMRGAGCYQ